MVDRLGNTTQYSVHQSGLDANKVVIGQKSGDIDQIDLAKKLMEARLSVAKTDEKKISKEAQKLSALQELRTLMMNFEMANNPLSNYQGTDISEKNLFHEERSFLTVINGENADHYIGATVTPGKNLIGNEYSLQVLQTAKKDMLRSDPAIAEPSAALGVAGNLVINGATISVVATDSLYDVQTKVQNTSQTTQVSFITAPAEDASVVFWLKSQQMAIPIDLNGSDTSILNALHLPASAADNLQLQTRTKDLQAKVSVDGYAFYRDTNVINDIIDGVTIEAKAVMPTETTLRFALNTEALTKATENWIGAFNELKTFLVSHTIPAKGDDPDGKHVLYRENIVYESLRMLNQALRGVDGLFGKQSSLKGFGIDFVNAADMSSALKYNPQELAKHINENIDAFKKVMGDDYNSSNLKLSIIGLPKLLPSPLANKNLTLTISNVSINALGETIFDATLSDGGLYSETLLQTKKTMHFKDKQSFGDFIISYDGAVPLTGDTATFNVTQGAASKMRSYLSNYLQEPLDVDDLDRKAVLNTHDDNEQRGDLSRHMYHILKGKKVLEKKVDEAQEKARSEYEKSLQKLQQHANEESKRKRISDMINVLYNTKR